MNPRSRQQVNAEAEAARNRAPITDRVNAEPAILNGMTVTEAQVIGAASLVVFLVLGGLIFVVIGQWQVLLMLAIFGPALVLWFSSLYLAKIKRGRPDGFYIRFASSAMTSTASATHGVLPSTATAITGHSGWT